MLSAVVLMDQAIRSRGCQLLVVVGVDLGALLAVPLWVLVGLWLGMVLANTSSRQQ